MRRYYLAYGSNLNVEQMKYRCPGAVLIGTGEIPGYELLYKGSKSGSYLTIEKAKGGKVPVAIWSVTERDESNLDLYEGFPIFYYKKSFKVGGHNCFAYIMHEDRPLGIPTSYYVRTCMEGYRAMRFDYAILERAFMRTKEGMA